MIVPSGPSRSRAASRAALFATGIVAALAGCHRVSVQPPPTPPAPTPAHVAAAPARDTVRRGYAAADVRFMHHMLLHHAQALVMTAMVPSRSARDDVKLVAERIAVSQRDETALMERWLRARGESVPAATEHAHHGGMNAGGGEHAAMMAAMPGMLTAAELAQLEASTGAAFDTLFVRFMIRHHEGALAMVKDYLATPGAAQESEIFRFASDIDADQRAEIRRLQGLLGR